MGEASQISFKMPTWRCQCKNITNKKICSNKSKNLFIFDKKRICTFHANYHYYNNITLIQSYYRGYNKRKYLNKIFYRLPYDVQKHIVYFLRQDFYIEKMNKKLELIIENKIYNFYNEFSNKFNIDKNVPFTMLDYLANNTKNIIHIYKLFIKYKSILSNIENIDYLLTNNFIKMRHTIKNYKNMTFNPYSNHIYEMASILYFNIDKLFNPNTGLSSLC